MSMPVKALVGRGTSAFAVGPTLRRRSTVRSPRNPLRRSWRDPLGENEKKTYKCIFERSQVVLDVLHLHYAWVGPFVASADSPQNRLHLHYVWVGPEKN